MIIIWSHCKNQQYQIIGILILLHKIDWSVLYFAYIFHSYMIFITSDIDNLRNICSLSNADLLIFDVFHYTVAKSLIFTRTTNFISKVSIRKLSSLQRLIEVFQSSNSHFKTQIWLLTKLQSVIFLDFTVPLFIVDKFVSNTSSLVSHRLSIHLFFQVKMIFQEKSS